VKRRILIVDDNEHDIALALAALEENAVSVDVDIAHDGQDALDFLYRRGAHAGRAATLPTVVLLDLKMPRVDGLEVLARLKADTEMRVLPVVMLTSSREEVDVIRSYKLGVNAYVVKPVDFDEFTSAIKDLGKFWGTLNQAPPLSA